MKRQSSVVSRQQTATCLLLIATCLLFSACQTTTAAMPVRPALKLERLQTLDIKATPIPPAASVRKDGDGIHISAADWQARTDAWKADRNKLAGVVAAHNSAVATANLRASMAETLDTEAGAYQRVSARTETALDKERSSARWNDIGHRILEFGLLAALFAVGL